jgi:hypothetical protein
MPNGKSETNRPVHNVRYGTIKAAIWRNVVDNGNASRPMYNVTISRSYKDVEDNWKDSQSFGYDDLLVVSKAMNDCHSWIAAQLFRDAQNVKGDRTEYREQPVAPQQSMQRSQSRR